MIGIGPITPSRDTPSVAGHALTEPAGSDTVERPLDPGLAHPDAAPDALVGPAAARSCVWPAARPVVRLRRLIPPLCPR